MRRETEAVGGAAVDKPAVDEAAVGKAAVSCASGARRWRGIFRRVFGAPDYDAYLDHCRTAGHPARLSEREYVAEFFESKGKGVRCC